MEPTMGRPFAILAGLILIASGAAALLLRTAFRTHRPFDYMVAGTLVTALVLLAWWGLLSSRRRRRRAALISIRRPSAPAAPHADCAQDPAIRPRGVTGE